MIRRTYFVQSHRETCVPLSLPVLLDDGYDKVPWTACL